VVVQSREAWRCTPRRLLPVARLPCAGRNRSTAPSSRRSFRRPSEPHGKRHLGSGLTDVLMTRTATPPHALAVSGGTRARGGGANLLPPGALRGAILSKESRSACTAARDLNRPLRSARTEQRCRRRAEISTHPAAQLSWDGGCGAARIVDLAIRAKTWSYSPAMIRLGGGPRWRAAAVHTATSRCRSANTSSESSLPWPHTFHFVRSPRGGEPVLFAPSVVLGVVAGSLLIFWLVRAWRRDRVLGEMPWP